MSRQTFKEEHRETHPEMVQFMWMKVEVQMAALLGEKTGGRKFSCRNCHLRE